MLDQLTELRVARLESEVARIRSDIAKMKFDRELALTHVCGLLQTVLLLGALARGFGWL